MIRNKIDLYKLLLQILNSIEPKRKNLIEKFQNYVRTEEIIGISEQEMDVYNTLADDLEFYEPNEEWRKEDISYYDKNQLIVEITQALNKLEEQK